MTTASLRRKLLLLLGCLVAGGGLGALQGAGEEPANTKEEEATLLKLDAEFSKLSADKGLATAFLTFMADDGTIVAPGTMPIVGKEDMRDLLTGNENTRLIWKPLKAEVARSGELGYTYGSYESRRERKNAPAKITTGKYVTVWKKQADGKWKATLEMGDLDPAPNAPAPAKTP